MIALTLVLLIIFVSLLGIYYFRRHCPRCGRLFPTLLAEKSMNGRNLRAKLITPTDLAWGCCPESYMAVCDVEYLRTYRCTNPRCLHTWKQVEQRTEEYKPRL